VKSRLYIQTNPISPFQTKTYFRLFYGNKSIDPIPGTLYSNDRCPPWPVYSRRFTATSLCPRTGRSLRRELISSLVVDSCGCISTALSSNTIVDPALVTRRQSSMASMVRRYERFGGSMDQMDGGDDDSAASATSNTAIDRSSGGVGIEQVAMTTRQRPSVCGRSQISTVAIVGPAQ